MIRQEPIGLINTGLPLVLLVAIAILLPRFMVHRDTRSQAQVGSAIGITALVLLALGTNLFAITYGMRGHAVMAAFGQNAIATGWFFLRLAGMAAIIWVPVLVLVWLTLAQGVERRRGEDMARGGV